MSARLLKATVRYYLIMARVVPPPRWETTERKREFMAAVRESLPELLSELKGGDSAKPQ